ncbi:MAG: UPF0175 family protein [bacterium]|nr:UPF0175 family protein [bacterium]
MNQEILERGIYRRVYDKILPFFSLYYVNLQVNRGQGKKEGEKVKKNRVMLAVDEYRESKASLEKAAKTAGVSIPEIMEILKKNGVEANVEFEDYLKSLKNLRKTW